MLQWFRPIPRLMAVLWLGFAPISGAGEASAADAAAPKAEDEAAQPPVFVPIEGLQVPIIESGEMRGRLRLEIVLEGVSTAALPAIRRDLPRFRDQALSAVLEHARLHVSPFAAVDAVRLSATLDTTLKDPSLKRILIVKAAAEPA